MEESISTVHFICLFIIAVSELIFGSLNSKEKNLHHYLLRVAFAFVANFTYRILVEHRPEEIDIYVLMYYFGSLILCGYMGIQVCLEAMIYIFSHIGKN